MESSIGFCEWIAVSTNKTCKLASSNVVVDWGRYGIITHYVKLCSRFILHMWYTTGYTIRQTRVPHDLTRSSKLRGTRRLPSHITRSTDFNATICVLFPALVTFFNKNKSWGNRYMNLIKKFLLYQRFSFGTVSKVMQENCYTNLPLWSNLN